MNKKLYFRSFSIVLVLCMFVMLMGACTKKENDNKSSQSSSEAAAEQNNEKQLENDKPQKDDNIFAKYTPQEKTYEINYVPNATAPIDKEAPIVKYYEDLLNVKFNIIFLEPQKRAELLNLKFASGDVPDIFGGNLAQMYEFVRQDLLTEIPEEVLREYCPVHAKEYDKYPEQCWDLSCVEGKMYGIPNINGHNQFRMPIIWRTDWLENVGINTIPSTIEEAEAAFYKFRNEDPDGNGKKDTYALSKEGINAVFGAYGIIREQWIEKDGKLAPSVIQPETKQALELLAKWYKDELIDPEFITGENKGGYAYLTHSFISGRIGFTCMGYYYHWKSPLYEGDFFGQNAQEISISNPEAKYDFGPVLKGPNGIGYMKQNDLVAIYRVLGRNLREQPDKVGKILQMVNVFDGSPEGFITRYYGFKDKHYTVDTAGRIKGIEPYTDVKELCKIGGHVTFQLAILPQNMFIGYSGWDKWAVENGFDKDGKFNSLPVPLPSDHKYKTELNKLWDEVYVSIVTGDKPADYFDEFVKEYKNIGGDKLMQEANDWYLSK